MGTNMAKAEDRSYHLRLRTSRTCCGYITNGWVNNTVVRILRHLRTGVCKPSVHIVHFALLQAAILPSYRLMICSFLYLPIFVAWVGVAGVVLASKMVLRTAAPSSGYTDALGNPVVPSEWEMKLWEEGAEGESPTSEPRECHL